MFYCCSDITEYGITSLVCMYMYVEGSVKAVGGGGNRNFITSIPCVSHTGCERSLAALSGTTRIMAPSLPWGCMGQLSSSTEEILWIAWLPTGWVTLQIVESCHATNFVMTCYDNLRCTCVDMFGIETTNLWVQWFLDTDTGLLLLYCLIQVPLSYISHTHIVDKLWHNGLYTLYG